MKQWKLVDLSIKAHRSSSVSAAENKPSHSPSRIATISSEVAELKQLVKSLQKEVTRLSGSSRQHVYCASLLALTNSRLDQEEIRKLQYKYGYYLDKCLYKEV